MEYDGLCFVPLGGCGEIGMNVNLYHYKGKWIIVDFGLGFAGDNLPGVDVTVADISFLKEKKEDILAMIITHAHEDHCGAVQYLWDYVACPIYTTPFTLEFLKEKLIDSSMDVSIDDMHQITDGQILDLGPFSIEALFLTHSISEMCSLIIRTEGGLYIIQEIGNLTIIL